MAFGLKNILSIDIDDDAVVVTELARHGNQVALVSSYVAGTLQELKNIFINRSQVTVVSLSSQGLYFKDFPLTQSLMRSKDEKRDIVSFLRKQNLPLSLEDCFWHVARRGNVLSLIAARKAQVTEILNQLNQGGFTVSGVAPSSYGLYNLLVHNHQEKGRFFLIYMRAASTDLIIHDEKRLWVYPLAIGRAGYGEGKSTTDEFMQELRRVVNTHFMQNPAKSSKAGFKIFLGGAVYPERFVSGLQEIFPGADVVSFEPFRKIVPPSQGIPPHAQVMGVSLGVGLTYFGLPNTIGVNLIGEKVKTERKASRINLVEKFAAYAAVLLLAGMILLNVFYITALLRQGASVRESRAQVASLLPQVKELKLRKSALEQADAFFERKLGQQSLLLQALAAVAAGKTASIDIDEFQVKETAEVLEVYISGTSWDYNEINEFLVRLKKNKLIRNVKIVSSSFPESQEDMLKAINFKLRFEIG